MAPEPPIALDEIALDDARGVRRIWKGMPLIKRRHALILVVLRISEVPPRARAPRAACGVPPHKKTKTPPTPPTKTPHKKRGKTMPLPVIETGAYAWEAYSCRCYHYTKTAVEMLVEARSGPSVCAARRLGT